MRNKITKIFLLLSMIIICGLMGCAWSPTTENEEESTKEQLREQLPEWYAQVWLDGFTDSLLTSYTCDNDNITINLSLKDGVDDYSTTIHEVFTLFARMDDYLIGNNLENNLTVSIGENKVHSSGIMISNNSTFNDTIYSAIKFDNESCIGRRFCYIVLINDDTKNPFVDEEISEHIDVFFVPYLFKEYECLNKFIDISTVYVCGINDDAIDMFDQFISDMEARGIEVIID